MGNMQPVNLPKPEDIKGPHCTKDPSYDPNFGFKTGRKERGLLIKYNLAKKKMLSSVMKMCLKFSFMCCEETLTSGRPEFLPIEG